MTDTHSPATDDAEARLRNATKRFEEAVASNSAEQTEIAKKAMEDAFNDMVRARK